MRIVPIYEDSTLPGHLFRVSSTKFFITSMTFKVLKIREPKSISYALTMTQENFHLQKNINHKKCIQAGIKNQIYLSQNGI